MSTRRVEEIIQELEEATRRAGLPIALSSGPGETPLEVMDRILDAIKTRANSAAKNNGATDAGRPDPTISRAGSTSVPNPHGGADSWPRYQPKKAAGDGHKSESPSLAGRNGHPGVSVAGEQDMDAYGQPTRARKCDKCGTFLKVMDARYRHARYGFGELCAPCYQSVEAQQIVEKIQAFNEGGA